MVARPSGGRGKYSAFSLTALARKVVDCEFGDEWKKKFMRITPNTLDKNLTPEQSAKRVQDAKNKVGPFFAFYAVNHGVCICKITRNANMYI